MASSKFLPRQPFVKQFLYGIVKYIKQFFDCLNHASFPFNASALWRFRWHLDCAVCLTSRRRFPELTPAKNRCARGCRLMPKCRRMTLRRRQEKLPDFPWRFLQSFQTIHGKRRANHLHRLHALFGQVAHDVYGVGF